MMMLTIYDTVSSTKGLPTTCAAALNCHKEILNQHKITKPKPKVIINELDKREGASLAFGAQYP